MSNFRYIDADIEVDIFPKEIALIVAIGRHLESILALMMPPMPHIGAKFDVPSQALEFKFKVRHGDIAWQNLSIIASHDTLVICRWHFVDQNLDSPFNYRVIAEIRDGQLAPPSIKDSLEMDIEGSDIFISNDELGLTH